LVSALGGYRKGYPGLCLEVPEKKKKKVWRRRMGDWRLHYWGTVPPPQKKGKGWKSIPKSFLERKKRSLRQELK